MYWSLWISNWANVWHLTILKEDLVNRCTGCVTWLLAPACFQEKLICVWILQPKQPWPEAHDAISIFLHKVTDDQDHRLALNKWAFNAQIKDGLSQKKILLWVSELNNPETVWQLVVDTTVEGQEIRWGLGKPWRAMCLGSRNWTGRGWMGVLERSKRADCDWVTLAACWGQTTSSPSTQVAQHYYAPLLPREPFVNIFSGNLLHLNERGPLLFATKWV